MDEDDEKVCRLLDELDSCLFDDLSDLVSGETDDSENTLMDEAVLPKLLMSNETKNNVIKMCDSRKYKVEKYQNVTDKNNKNLPNQSNEEIENMRYKSERIDVLVDLENDRRKVINVRRYDKVKHLKRSFLKSVKKDPIYTRKMSEGAEIVFQTYHEKFKKWVDAEKDLVLTDGMNLKVIFANDKTKKGKELKRSSSDVNIEETSDETKNQSTHKSKKLKSSISRYARDRSPSPKSTHSWSSPQSRLTKTLHPYSSNGDRDSGNERLYNKSHHLLKRYPDSKRGKVSSSHITEYNRNEQLSCQMVTTTYNEYRTSYYNRTLPSTDSHQQVDTKFSYSEELDKFLKIVEKKKNEKDELPVEKLNNEVIYENPPQYDEVQCEDTVETDNETKYEEAQYILLSKKEIELFRARLRINEKHPVQAVQEICTSVYKHPPSFELCKEERCPKTNHMRFTYTLNVLGNIFTPRTPQFTKKAAKVDAAVLFLKHIGFK